jgi:hypothetical protein
MWLVAVLETMNGQEESTSWAGFAYGRKFCISYMKKCATIEN